MWGQLARFAIKYIPRLFALGKGANTAGKIAKGAKAAKSVGKAGTFAKGAGKVLSAGKKFMNTKIGRGIAKVGTIASVVPWAAKKAWSGVKYAWSTPWGKVGTVAAGAIGIGALSKCLKKKKQPEQQSENSTERPAPQIVNNIVIQKERD